MQLYVLDRSKNVLATTEGFYNDMHHKELTAGASTYVFDLNKSDEAAKYMVSGNIITMLDDQGRPWSFEILYYDEYQTYKTIHCEDVGINLFNKACDVWYYTEAKPFADYFNVITAGTPWELGVNQLADLSRTLTFTGRDTGLGRLLSVLKAFDDAECVFNIQMKGPVPVKYVIDVYKKIGTVQDNIQIAYNEELDNIQKTETRQEFATALSGVGSVIQDTETNADGSPVNTDKPQEYVNFADLEYDNGGFYTTKGDKFIRARMANAQFNPGDQGFIEDFYEYDTKSSSELFNRTLAQIQTRSQPQFKYEADVKVIDPNLDIGDTVTIIDHDYNPALYLQARVATLEKSYTDTTKGSITFTNYVVLTDTVTRQIAALKSKVNGIKNGSSSYVWIRYADDDKGTNISQSPKDKTYVAILSKVNQPVPSDNPNDYAGHWVRIAGEDGLNGQIGPQGHDGADGIPGKDGRTSYTHIAYADTAIGGRFSQSSDNKKYIGIYTDFTADDSSDVTKYNWSLIKGADGANGKDGVPGKAGTDGKTPYFHIAYADSADGNTNFSLDTPGSRKYIGSYTDFTQADSTNQALYSWQLAQGPKGDTGVDGVAGKDGVGIKSTAIAYQLSSSGTTAPIGTWSATVPTLTKGQYLWTRTTLTYTDNSGELVYSVSYVAKDGNNGTDGVAGKDGVGIKSTTITYQSGTSGTVQPTGIWVANPPSVTGGNYLWTRTVWSYTDGTSETGYSVARAGEKGDKGDTGADGLAGKDGIGIKSTAITYALGDSGTATPTTSWTTSVPSLVKGKYLWTKTVWTYTDNSFETGYSVTYISKDGNNGSNGLAGKDGTGIKTTTITYAGSTSGTTAPTSGWTSTVPTVAAGSYLWTKTVWDYTDNTSETGYSVAKMGEKGDQGIKGPSGTDGKTSYTHIAYANSATGEGFSELPAGKTYIGMYVDFTSTDSTDVTKYKWTLAKGSDGANGTPGKTGADGRTPYLHIAYADSADGKNGFYVGGGSNYLRNSDKSISDFGQDLGTMPNEVLNSLAGKTITISVDTEWSGFQHSDSKQNRLGFELGAGGSDGKSYWLGAWKQPNTPSGKERVSTTYTLPANVTFTVSNNGHNGYVSINGTGIVSHAKIEMGTPTPWSPASEDNVQPKYMGTYTDYTQADSTDPTQYLWSLIKGTDGANGKDGEDAYLHIAYANSVDGNTDFITDQSQAHNRDYLGTYSDNTKAQSKDPTKYTWQLTRGAQGLQGQPGAKDVPVVIMSSTAPPSPKNGDFWYQTTTDASGQKITGFSVYSNGKWVPSKIDQSTLVLTKLVSVEIDSAIINSPDITVPFDYFDEKQIEFKGSMEFKDGMLKHISTDKAGGMLKTVVNPTGYTLSLYHNQSDYTKNDPYINSAVYADEISFYNKNIKKSGFVNSSSIGGSLNTNTDDFKSISINWADVQKYLPEMSAKGNRKFFDWFDVMSSVQSHPNLIRNSSFVNKQANWDLGSAGFVSNDLHDGNFVLQIRSAGGSNFVTQTLANFPWVNNQISFSFWANIINHDGGLNAGAFIAFNGGGKNYNATIQDAGKGLSTGWKFYSFDPITVPNGTSSVNFAFYNNEHAGNFVHFAQPMMNAGSNVAPYMPTY